MQVEQFEYIFTKIAATRNLDCPTESDNEEVDARGSATLERGIFFVLLAQVAHRSWP